MCLRNGSGLMLLMVGGVDFGNALAESKFSGVVPKPKLPSVLRGPSMTGAGLGR